MKNQRVKKILTWIIVPLMAFIFVFDSITVLLGNHYARAYALTLEAETPAASDDRIHFLNTANSDCILIESNGRFALIDSGEGDHNPRRKTEYPGFEQRVTEYIKKTCRVEGEVRLEFVLGTHLHYDHIGCFHAILTDPEIQVGQAYFKPYDPRVEKNYEIKGWKLGMLYDQIVQDLAARQIPLVSEIPAEPFKFGDFTIQFYNTVTPESLYGRGENAASIGTLVQKGNKRAFLAADITKTCGLEEVLIPLLPHVDLLKAGHHGYYGSSSRRFLKTLTPSLIIVPNQQGKVYPNVKWNFTLCAKAPYYATYDYNGVIATFTDDDQIVLTHDLH